MAFGIRVVGDSGAVQIDETWRNFELDEIRFASVTASYYDQDNVAGTYSMTVAGENVMVACRAEQLCPVMLHSYFDGTNYTYNWMFFTDPAAGGVTITETVKFYIFNLMPLSGYPSWGASVFDAAGKRVWHSDADLLKVGGKQSGYSSFSGASGRSFVPLIERNPIITKSVGGVGYRVRSMALRVSGSTIYPTEVGRPGWGASGTAGDGGSYAAIDVTGF